MAESFFNAWSNAFQSKPKHRLFCTWHVDRAWRKNLQKIQYREMHLEVYKILRTLMEKKDVDAFNIKFNKVLKKFLENDTTREFYHKNCPLCDGASTSAAGAVEIMQVDDEIASILTPDSVGIEYVRSTFLKTHWAAASAGFTRTFFDNP
ncbi:MULE domain-containing protein [Trichonephila clavata]|uniref:MULE domain-containing protein n=1 Tax=Trichonephila clavata TaxID=2740835 RepID=A0A8X6IJ35_TRICU|nr:MULE domain-containing protein [Trichonephila clavata]